MLKQDAKFLLLSPFTSSPGDKGPPLNQNFTGLDSLACQRTLRTHLPPDPSDDVTGARVCARIRGQLLKWVLGIQIPLFPEELFLPTEPSPSPDTVTVEQGSEPHRSEPLRVSPKSVLSCPSADL